MLDLADTPYAPDTKDLQDVMEAVNDGDLLKLKSHLATTPNATTILNRQDKSSGETVLTAAAKLQSHLDAVEIVKALTQAGADPELKNRMGQSPLHIACRTGNAFLVTELLATAKNVNEADVYGQTALFSACRYGGEACAREMVKGGADVNWADGEGDTPLFYAVHYGHLIVCQLLLDSNATVNAVNKKNKTALNVASSQDQTEIAKLLKSHGALHYAQLQKAELGSKAGSSSYDSGHQTNIGGRSQLKRQKPKQRAAQPKFLYSLVHHDGQKPLNVTMAQFEEFRVQHPTAAFAIFNPGSISEAEHLKSAIEVETWREVALAIVEKLLAAKGGHIFAEPVDVEKLCIPDYPAIVSKPMDLGTIRVS